MNTATKLMNLAHGASADLEGWAGINVTPQQFLDMLEALLKNKEYFLEEIDYPDAYLEPAGGLDTCVRDMVFDVVVFTATGRYWPCNMDGEEVMIEFARDLELYLAK